MRIFFAVDVHGATTVWKKWISAAEIYKANALLLAGDLTGKVLVPLIDQGDGTYKASYYGKTWVLKNESEISDFERKLDNGGVYYKRITKEEVEEMKNKQELVADTINKLMVDRIRTWLNLLIEKVDTKNILTIVMPGNDDEFVIDPVIKEFEDRGIIYPLEKVIEIEGHEMISLAYTNPTPWNTPREMEDKALSKIIEKEVKKMSSPDNGIFNFHCPPYETNLDLAPKLDKSMKIVSGFAGVEYVHVGSKAVRDSIKKYQPLLGLHGHIHESAGYDNIGKTLVLNPGSEYGEGLLKGYIIDVTRDGIEKYWKIQG
ncbi:MAG: phosphoesterase [Thermoplasmata archaeon]